MRTYTESAGGHLSGYVNMSGITGKENSGWIPDSCRWEERVEVENFREVRITVTMYTSHMLKHAEAL